MCACRRMPDGIPHPSACAMFLAHHLTTENRSNTIVESVGCLRYAVVLRFGWVSSGSVAVEFYFV